ncbi:sugar ABC transporter ATP-binding protein [Fusibacillus kribbianus]|uniref:Sugar ABC transporter ATP-binding protein n=1 Tax=Fusibacillus kribbianus TaxID=3044208 RepID=A0AAP4BE08_9FIRM|nr:sugar ABC transporter ATP-binding protein [Ruminococcus sp. YH-rum2234]MDI9243291.1 sugar ABC transporter ATP-binding protein [Ruminococcus sp. YH-rum2234]
MLKENMDEQDVILEFSGITKSFPGVKALDNVSFSVKKGTVHALVGENGAGKSTLMKILNGLYHADSGKVLLNGKEVQIRDSIHAQQLGIGMVHQELNVIGELSIAENIFLGKEPKNRLGLIDHKKLNSTAKTFLLQQKLPYSPSLKMKEMSIGEQQMIEIIKTVYFNSKIIVMDEPTSSLSESEVEKLFTKIRELKKQGSTIIYISHRLEELDEICDYLTIMRDGQFIRTVKVGEITKNEIISEMVGRTIENTYPKVKAEIGDVILEAKKLSNEKIKDVSFCVKRGEILGFAGLVGAGRTEVARAVFGMDELKSGEIYMEGEKISIKTPKDAVDNGIMMVSEDRRKYGLVTKRSVLENISLPNYDRFSKTLFVNHKAEKNVSAEIIKKLSIKTPNLDTMTASLSGGNQQKIVIGKWLVASPKVFILDEPTRGIDVGAKYEIYKQMCEFAAEGMSIIMISSDLPELLGMADRIYVMSEGRITGELLGEEANQMKVMHYATVNR